MTDGHSEAIEHSRRNQGTELTKRDSGGLIARASPISNSYAPSQPPKNASSVA